MKIKFPKLPPFATPIILLAIAVLIGAILLFIRSRGPGTQGQLDFNSLLPGKSKLSQVTEKLGQPLSSEPQPNGTLHKFDSGNQFYPHQVLATPDETVSSITQYLTDKPKDNQIEKYTQLTGTPPITLYNRDSLSGINLYVWPQSGIAVKASQNRGLGYYHIYFPPTDITTFISQYAPDYSQTLDEKKLYSETHGDQTPSAPSSATNSASPSARPKFNF